MLQSVCVWYLLVTLPSCLSIHFPFSNFSLLLPSPSPVVYFSVLLYIHHLFHVIFPVAVFNSNDSMKATMFLSRTLTWWGCNCGLYLFIFNVFKRDTNWKGNFSLSVDSKNHTLLYSNFKTQISMQPLRHC